MEKILISACLLGDPVRYDGKIVIPDKAFLRFFEKQFVKVCPEVAGGMGVPRPPAQIVNGNGLDVLKGQARVRDIRGRDVTDFFIRGAEYSLSVAEKFHIRLAVLKEKSPSCGTRRIYDGSFASTLVPGSGVTAALLMENGIKVFSEHELDLMEEFLKTGI